MIDLLTSVPKEEEDQFWDYHDDWFSAGFDHATGLSDGFCFERFKRIVREAYKLWDSWDPLDYEAVKVLSGPRVRCLADVALVCYNHNETWFREQVMTWMELATIKEEPEEEEFIFVECSPWCIRYTRNNHYELSC